MNQDQIKTLLLGLEDTALEFSVTMTGKKSRKVNGLYKPDTREILLHNKNFTEDNQLVYTAIHEYAHHLVCERDGVLQSAKSHTTAFWACFHGLLEKAEKKGLYSIGIEKSSELSRLTEEIRSKYLAENGKLMSDLGKLLMKAHSLCEEAGVRYEDYVDRVLCLPRTAAKTAVRVSSLGINPSLGWETMKVVASQPTPERRAEAERQFTAHRSPDSVKVNLARNVEDEDPKERLEKERRRLEKTIAMLRSRLDQVEQSLSNL
jgi:hypothetical protein